MPKLLLLAFQLGREFPLSFYPQVFFFANYFLRRFFILRGFLRIYCCALMYNYLGRKPIKAYCYDEETSSLVGPEISPELSPTSLCFKRR